MTDKIDPEQIAEDTGLTTEQVNKVLSHLVPSWLFSRMIDNDMSDVDYYDMREGRHEYAED